MDINPIQLQPNRPAAHATSSDYNDNAVFTWLGGVPSPRGRAAMAREQMTQLHHAALALPYEGEWDPDLQEYVPEDPRYVGMTLGEVMVLRRAIAAASGNEAAYRDIADRVMGKAKQSVESVNMDMSYTDFLDMLSRSDPAAYEYNSNYDNSNYDNNDDVIDVDVTIDDVTIDDVTTLADEV